MNRVPASFIIHSEEDSRIAEGILRRAQASRQLPFTATEENMRTLRNELTIERGAAVPDLDYSKVEAVPDNGANV